MAEISGRGVTAAAIGFVALALQFGCATAVADDGSARAADRPDAAAGPARPGRSDAVVSAARTGRVQAHRDRRPAAVAAAPAPATVPAPPAASAQRLAATTVPTAGARRTDRGANAVTASLQGALALASTTGTQTRRWPPPTLGWVPRYDHIVVVVLENHSFDEIRGLANTNQAPVPYLNNTLVPGGALMTSAYGLQHPSQPNYYWLFSGSNQGITTDAAPISKTGTNTVNAKTKNLYTELQSLCRPKTFVGFAEGYTGVANLSQGEFTSTGTIASETGTGELLNVVRHMPWAGFANVPQSVSAGFDSFGPDYSTLPSVSFVIPALQHDMHNYTFGSNEVIDVPTSDVAMANADAWLSQNIDGYAQWARTHNSLLIITTDEDSTPDWPTPPLPYLNYSGPIGTEAVTPGAPGFTSAAQGPSPTDKNPSGSGQSGPNTIFTLFYGAHVVPGSYSNDITNVNVLRTIEASMRVHSRAGAQPSFVGKTASGKRDWSLRFNNHAVNNIFSIFVR